VHKLYTAPHTYRIKAMLRITDDITIEDWELSEQFVRASGPGGQHRNKVETAIRLTHRPTGVAGQASERRSQAQNHAVALTRLRVNLALSVRTPTSTPAPGSFPENLQVNTSGSSSTRERKTDTQKVAAHSPSPLWRSRVRGGRLAINPQHDDFPALLAEALDHLQLHQHDVPPAAEVLGVSGSQLLKLLRHEPRALDQLNTHRLAIGLPRLR